MIQPSPWVSDVQWESSWCWQWWYPHHNPPMKDWRGPPLSKLLVLCYCPPLWIFSWTNPFLPSSSSSKFQYWDSGGQFDNHAIKFYFQCRVVELRWNPDISGKIQNLQIVRNPREGMTWPRSPGEKEEEAVIVYLTSWGWSSDLFAQLVGYLNFIENIICIIIPIPMQSRRSI